jgi:5-methylcytosine-specific restriction endonuclease McrA
VLRVDKNAEIVLMPWTVVGLFQGRYAVRSGKRIFGERWKADAFEDIRERQKQEPVAMIRNGKRTLWRFHDAFYWEDDGLASDDVKALVLQRERRSKQQLRTAHSLMRAEASGRPTRLPVPDDVKRVVFERDGGRCVECGSNFNLQYDHIIPVARGGATTVENLQVLCADCNRRKSDSL